MARWICQNSLFKRTQTAEGNFLNNKKRRVVGFCPLHKFDQGNYKFMW